MSKSTNTIVLGSSQVQIKNNKAGTYLLPSDGFKLINVTFREGILTLPTFVATYSSVSPFDYLDGLEDLSFQASYDTSDGKSKSLAYDYATITSAGPNTLSGVLISKEQYFTRKSQALNTNLKDSIVQLGIRKSVDNIVNSSSEVSFYQLNETDWECTERLLNLTDQDKVWAIAPDKIKIFSVSPSNPTETSLGVIEQYVFDNRKTGKNLTSQSAEASNFYYGRKNICVPSLSKYPRSCLTALLAKTKFKDGWANSSLSKTFPLDPNYELGQSVKFTEWEKHGTFIVVGKAVSLGQTSSSFTYTFANYSDWNVAEE